MGITIVLLNDHLLLFYIDLTILFFLTNIVILIYLDMFWQLGIQSEQLTFLATQISYFSDAISNKDK